MTSLVDLTAPAELRSKQEKLIALLRDIGPVIVAYSGGTDSAYLAWAAHQALGAEAIAIIKASDVMIAID